METRAKHAVDQRLDGSTHPFGRQLLKDLACPGNTRRHDHQPRDEGPPLPSSEEVGGDSVCVASSVIIR